MTIFSKYRRKPVIVEAVQWQPEDPKFAGLAAKPIIDEICATGHQAEYIRPIDAIWGHIIIQTLEGPFNASPGDYICRGIKGEYWPVKPDVFTYTNEPVGE